VARRRPFAVVVNASAAAEALPGRSGAAKPAAVAKAEVFRKLRRLIVVFIGWVIE
jgi:hypothetical protein